MTPRYRPWFLDADTEIEPVLDWCLAHHGVNRLILMARLKSHSERLTLRDPEVGDFIESTFEDHILERRQATAWPGTVVEGTSSLLFTIAFTQELIRPMAEAGRLVRAWVPFFEPPLPEDPCLYRLGDDRPTFVSTTHDHTMYILTPHQVNLEGAEPVDRFRPFFPPAETEFIGLNPSDSDV